MYQNTTADYSDGKIDAERYVERVGVFKAVEYGAGLAARNEDSAAYIAGFRIRAAQLARAEGLPALDDWVGPGS